ncbi:MAG: hypothetical protein N2643_01530 [Endomicrobia bacterium]|nr:hypothetical protein [Endomicrobiia bacterium]
MKKIKCPICGTENKVGIKYCRICFSRLISSNNKIPTVNLHLQIARRKNFFSFILIVILLIILWFMIYR